MADSFAPFGPQLKCLVLREAHVVATGNPSSPIAPFCFLHSTLTWRKPHFPLPVPLLFTVVEKDGPCSVLCLPPRTKQVFSVC